MIVHIIPDSSFLDPVIPLLLEVSSEQRFVVLLNGNADGIESHPLRHNRDKVCFVPASKVEDYCNDLRNKGLGVFVVFHCLTGVNVPVIRKLKDKYPLGWIPWGGCDAYDYLPLHGRHLGTFVHELLESGFHNKISLLLHVLRHGILYRIFPRCDPYIVLRSYFTWCFPLISEDYKTYRNHVGSKLFPAKCCEVSYWCYEREKLPDVIRNLDDDENKHQNIMIGNMGSPKYNHREVYSLLKPRRSLMGRKVYASFGYGEKGYSDKAIALGTRVIGDAFVPLTEFMPKDEYFRLIASCGVYITDHIVQGGLGTMQLALLAGSKLYLNPAGPIYRFFKDVGFIVCPLPKVCGPDFLNQLTLKQKQHNQNLCLSYWGREANLDRFRKMVAACDSTLRSEKL